MPLRKKPHCLFLLLALSFQVAAAQAVAAPDAASAKPQPSADPSPPASDEPPPAGDEPASSRRASLFEQNTISGSTGLLRLIEPSSGAAGTFRLSLLADWFTGNGFLCNSSTPCGTDTRDSASHFGSVLGLSVTPLSYLEAYASLRSFANSDDQHAPGLLDVLGNTTLGAKAFTPDPIAGLLSLGGSAELDLLNGSGSVGINGKSTSFRIAALGGLDLRRLEGGALPLRVTTNLGYFADNSGSLVHDVEVSRDARITRVERFGLGINRVDRVQTGLGVEGIWPLVRPFVEWNLEVPVNRQQYTCSVRTRFAGDQCLADDDKLSAFPSTLTLGARVFPLLKGLSATAALDIGTSGTSNFIEELAPTLPWDLWIGVGYAFDVVEPAPQKTVVVRTISVPTPLPPKPTQRARGFVHEKGKENGVANAILHYQGRELTAMASGADGRFVTADLEPGTYTFSIEAEGFKPGECAVVIPAEADLPAANAPTEAATAAASSVPSGAAPVASASAPVAPGSAPNASQITYSTLDCELEPLPSAGAVSGRALDADTGTPIIGVTVELSDPLGRSLHLDTDSNGAFRFEQVLPGTITIKAEGPAYLFHKQSLDLHPREQARSEISLHKRPKTSLVEVTANEIKIKQQIHFDHDSASILGDSNALLEQITDALARTPRIARVEIQGHTDDSGTPEHNKNLSEARANAVLDWLVEHGVEPNRLVARGYGQERPISPNVTPQGRSRNRRVQFVIVEQASQ
jgi:outer membrane protein OmpA-like peptidoglycan-associated protein